MAEQRPYRLPGTASDASLGQARLSPCSRSDGVRGGQLGDDSARRELFGYSPGSGARIFPEGEALYRPWDWMVWWWRWHWSPPSQPLWEIVCARSGLPDGLRRPLRWARLRSPAMDGSKISDLHGSARWANARRSSSGRLIEQHSSVRRPASQDRRRTRENPETFSHRAGVYLGVWRRMGTGFIHTRLRPCAYPGFRSDPERQGRRHRDSDTAHMAALGPGSRSQGRELGADCGRAQTDGSGLSQVCAGLSRTSDGARFNPLAEVRLRTPHEIRDVRNIVQMIIDPDGKGLPDHWSREGFRIPHRLHPGPALCRTGQDAQRNRSPAFRSGAADRRDSGANHAGRARPIRVAGLERLARHPTRTHPIIARAMRSMLDKSANERSGVISEVKGFLELYRDPVIAANTAISDFRIKDLMNHRRPVSLYIVVPLAHKNSLRPLIRLMLGQILHRLTERLEFRNGRAVTGYRHRLLLMIDEFPSLGRLDMFAESLSLIAGYGIKACLIAQDLSQIHAAYGHDEAITSNCHTRVAFTPNRIETARLLSQMTGEDDRSPCAPHYSSSGASVSEPEVARPLITPDEAMRLGANEALIFTSGRPAIRATKIRYYTEPFFKRRAQILRRQKATVSRTPPRLSTAGNQTTTQRSEMPEQETSDSATPFRLPSGKLTT